MEGDNAYIKQQLQGLHDRIRQLQEQIAPLLQQCRKFESQADHLHEYLSLEEGHIPVSASPVQSPSVKSKDRRAARELIESVLRRAMTPLHYTAILDRLKTEENYDMPGKDPSANISARLSVADRFVRISRGVYGLREWGLPTEAQSAVEALRRDAERHDNEESDEGTKE